MNLLWDASTLRRLRSRLRRSHPAAVRRAAVPRAWRRWQNLLHEASKFAIVLPISMIWLAGGVYAWRRVPIEASAGLAAVFWMLAARIIYHCAKNISVRVPPEILLLVPCGENEAIARRRIRRELLKLRLGALAVAFWVAVCFARRGEFSWPRCAGAAGLLWVHVLIIAAAMPRAAPAMQRLWQKLCPQPTPARVRLGLTTLFTLLFIGLTAAQFALGKLEVLPPLGKALALVLPPAGFLQWAAHPQAFPYWQSAVTLLLIWPALPVLRQWRKRWSDVPFIATPISWYWSANHEDEEEEDEYSEAPVHLPAPLADPRAALRAHLDSDRLDPDHYLLPTAPPLTLQSFLPLRGHLLTGLAAVALGVLSGQGLGTLIGWVWLLVPTVNFGTLPWLCALWRGNHTLGRIAVHEWLPIPARPMWETVARHQHRGALSCIGGAALLCLAGGVVTWLASLVPPLWSWHYPLKSSPHAIADIAFTACTGIAFAIRAAAPMRFAVQLLPTDRLTFTTRLAGFLPGMLNLGSLLAIVVSACIFTDPFFNSRPLTTEYHLLPALAFLAASEILRILAARLYLWLWAHGRRR